MDLRDACILASRQHRGCGPSEGPRTTASVVAVTLYKIICPLVIGIVILCLLEACRMVHIGKYRGLLCTLMYGVTA